jgi:hypothetical protein
VTFSNLYFCYALYDTGVNNVHERSSSAVRITVISLILFALVVVMPLPRSEAYGIAVSPSQMYINDMLRGTSADYQIRVYNPDPTYTLRYDITVNDTISDTISVSPSTGTIPPQSSTVVVIQARVSTTKPNGLYNGTVHVSSAIEMPSENNPTGVVVQPAVNVVVSYSVTDQQKSGLVVNSLQLFDTEEGMAFPLSMNATGTGNVDAQPVIRLDLTGVGNNSAKSTYEITNVTIKPRMAQDVHTTYPNTLPKGQYVARADVLFNGTSIFNMTKQVEVFEKGILKSKGELTLVKIDGSTFVNTGDTVKLIAPFTNTGEIGINGTLVCEVREDVGGSNVTGGKLVGTAQSNTLAVLPGQTVDLATYYTPQKAGSYIVLGHVQYANKVTENKGTVLTVSDSGSGILPIVAGIVIIGALIATGLYYLHRTGRWKI